MFIVSFVPLMFIEYLQWLTAYSAFQSINLFYLAFYRRQVERGFERINIVYEASSRRYSLWRLYRTVFCLDVLFIALESYQVIRVFYLGEDHDIESLPFLLSKLMAQMIGLQFSTGIKIAAASLKEMSSELKRTRLKEQAAIEYVKRYRTLVSGCKLLAISYVYYIWATMITSLVCFAPFATDAFTWQIDDGQIFSLMSVVYHVVLPWQIIESCESLVAEVRHVVRQSSFPMIVPTLEGSYCSGVLVDFFDFRPSTFNHTLLFGSYFGCLSSGA